jgi:hypothetical protein
MTHSSSVARCFRCCPNLQEAAAPASAAADVQGRVGDDGLCDSGASESEAPPAQEAIASEAKVSPTQGCLKSYAAKSLTGSVWL